MIASNKIINFNAGPAALPQEVVQQVAEAVLQYADSGTSILSIHHRGKYFLDILEESKQLVKELCGLNDDYEVLWLQGGGRMQFAMIPMNFLNEGQTAYYIDSGSWASDAIAHAQLYGNVQVLSSSKDHNYQQLPEIPSTITSNAAYLHLTSNNTIYGTQLQELPTVDVPLVVDMSSDIFSKRIDYSKCSLFYAVAQKNMGPAGATLVVLRKDMLSRIKRQLAPILDFKKQVEKNSVLNTAPVFPIYVSLLTLRWIKEKGIEQIEADNRQKADLLYAEVQRNTLFNCQVEDKDRSMMNVCFNGIDKTIEEAFINFAQENGCTNIKGHRYVGGLRVSLYNAISLEDVKYFIAVMQEFELSRH